MPGISDATRDGSAERDKSFSLEKVLQTEHAEITAARILRGVPEKPKGSGKFPLGEVRATNKDKPLPAPTPDLKPDLNKKPEWQKPLPPWNDWLKAVSNAHTMNLVGLSFSGGGIRSATFNLGVLQALADLKLLYRIDYLSTVSGGGYIGGWLAAWIKREGSFRKVQRLLSAYRVDLEDDIESMPIRSLRTYSNYLTPRLGLFSGDTLAMVAIYLRNLLLNQSVIVGLLATLLLLPRAILVSINYLFLFQVTGNGLAGLELCLLVVATYFVAVNMERLNQGLLEDEAPPAEPGPPKDEAPPAEPGPLEAEAPPAEPGPLEAEAPPAEPGPPKAEVPPAEPGPPKAEAPRTKQRYGPSYIVAGFGLASFVAGLWLHVAGQPLVWGWKVPYWACGLAGYSIFWWLGLGFIKERTEGKDEPGTSHEASGTFARRFNLAAERFVKRVGGALGTGAMAGWLYGILAGHPNWWCAKSALTFGVPLVVGIAFLAATLHIGLQGSDFRDERREWWGRLGGLMLALGVGWVALFWVVLYFPEFFQPGKTTFLGQTIQNVATKYLTPAWILTTIGSVLAGNSQASGKPGEKATTHIYLDLLAKVGPYVFIVGLVCWMSWGLDRAPFNECWKVFPALVICALVTWLMSWRVDINQFSMHMFYRNRLVSSYLGATNQHRRPNLFTGIDPRDDLPLKDFQNLGRPARNSAGQACDTSEGYDGPYPIINMSMNLVKGKDLAWQERKAESFVMTPRFCGYDVFLEQQYSKMQSDEFKEAYKHKTPIKGLDLFGYRPTEEYAFPCNKPGYHGPNLGLAMAISGAAASPNMGYYTTTAVAFLLTVFNVRLGQWLGNPRNPKTSRNPTPTLGLGCLMQELFAGTNDESDYVYLSDGGHFDNMGLYELVKRRCGLIIVCDAEADAHYGFAGLSDAIKKCRIDLGIAIDIDTKPIVPNKSGVSKQHYAIGKIHYEQADVEAPVGKIIYIKSSLTGKEPADVTTYKKRHSAFPHEDTANQWFTESQFESYRRLGYEAVYSTVFPRKTPDGAAARSRLLNSEIFPICNEFHFQIPDPNHAPNDRLICPEGI